MYIFVYGTLKKAYKELNPFTQAFHEHTEWICDTAVEGNIYLMDWYPALQLIGNNVVHGEIYKINTPTLLEKIDAYEDALTEAEFEKLKPFNKIPCEYVRKTIHIAEMPCWVYEYVEVIDASKHIKTGVFEMK